jgi:hypothetical protein
MRQPPPPPPRRGGQGAAATGPDSGDSAASARPRHVIEPDFARDILADLYTYRRKRRALAWLLWVPLGWMGAHRFYLERPITGLLMLITGGGALVWWVVDAFRLGRMVDEHNAEQRRREAEGLPPIELAFMPSLADDALREPPPWSLKWQTRGRAWRSLRLAGDLLVLLIAGTALGSLAGQDGGLEAIFAVVALVLVTMLAGRTGWLDRIPGAHALVRWSHRLRLFYYYNRPGTPAGLLVRPVVGLLMAPFRRRERAEARLYLEVGAVFTLVFMTLDLVEDVGAPLVRTGLAALAPPHLARVWIEEAFMTFLVTYAFATPIGAVLTMYLLTRETHVMPRLLGAFALFWIAFGAGLFR